MTECRKCNLCNQPGTFEQAREIARVPCCINHFKSESFTVWRCTICGSLHSLEDVNLPLYYKHYPFKDHTLDYHTKVAYRNRLKLLLQRGVASTARLLDYGCGAGVFLEFLKKRGFTDLHGYDAFIPKYADPQILEQQYDVVTSYDVIEHVDEPRAYLRALLKPLKPGGLLVLGTPNADYVRLKADPFFPVELSQPYHRHIFSEKALFGLCQEFEIEIVHVYRRFYFDSMFPAVNTRFMWEYVNRNGGVLDVCVQPLRWSQVLFSPRLFFYAFFGYFFPEHGNILISFRKSAEEQTVSPHQYSNVKSVSGM